MYPTLVDLCRLQPVQDLEGASLAKVLDDPSTAEDREVFLPDHDPGGYAIINQDWRLIHYSDGTEEFYDVRADPHEWHNLAADQKFQAVKQRLRAGAPDSFAPPATPKNQLRLVIDGTTFRWEPKPKP